MRNFFKKSAAVAAACLLLTQGTVCSADAAENTIDFSYLGAVGSLTADQTQKIAESIYQGLADHQEIIKVGNSRTNYINPTIDDMNSVIEIYRSVVSAWDVGVLTSRRTISYQVPQNGSMRLVPEYLETENYDAVYQQMMQKIDTIVSGVDMNWSAAEKALYLHDYLAVHYDYDYTEYTDSVQLELQHAAYGMLKKDMAVCEAYAWLYNIVLHRVGVDAMLLESDNLVHAWNLVYIDGNWYHVDITWDDAYNHHAGLVQHNNFLKSNETMKTTGHTSSDWVLTSGHSVYDLNVSDFYADGFWNNCITAIQPYQGGWFAIHSDPDKNTTTAWFDLCSFDADTCTTEIQHLNSLDAKWARWYVFDKEGYYYSNTYVTPAIAGDTIYYTTPEAVFAWKDQQVTWLFNLDSEQLQNGYLYGMYEKDHKLYYYVSTAPDSDPIEYVYELPETENNTETSTEESTETTTTTPETTTTTTETTTTTTPETTTTTSSTSTTTTTTTSTTTTTTTTTSTTTTTTTTTTPETTTTTETTSTTTTTAPETTATEETTIVTESETETEPPAVSGDLDGDHQLSVSDAIMIQKYLLGGQILSQEEYYLADMTNDGIVNIYDFIALKRSLLNK